jgi:hypothetical protein
MWTETTNGKGATAANDNAQGMREANEAMMPANGKLSKANQDRARWEKIVALPIGSRVVVNAAAIKKWPQGMVLSLDGIDRGVNHIFVSHVNHIFVSRYTILPRVAQVYRLSRRVALNLELMPQVEQRDGWQMGVRNQRSEEDAGQD